MNDKHLVSNGFELTGKALVLHPYGHRGAAARLPGSCLEEAVGLASAIGLDIAHSETNRLARPAPATLLGPGKVDEIAALVDEERIEVAIIDAILTPIQQRNLEQRWHCKVIDRTGLILEIFAARAQTREGVLQVELAQLTYQRSRLVRAWTHLERQRGGLGTVGGPGERQIESDRRAIDDRIVMLRKRLDSVTRTRELHRKRRRDAPWPVVALVGYTNAGKSTLFNRLAQAEVIAEDRLFATLDPTMRGFDLPSGQRVVLSDTVGFISNLPTHLVAAFRATLEELLEADLIVHVRDVSHPDSEAQAADVDAVLDDLGLDEVARGNMLLAMNKIDLVDELTRQRIENSTARDVRAVAVSAISGEGLDELQALIDADLRRRRSVVGIDLAPSDGEAIAWLYRNGEVVERIDTDAGVIRLRVGLTPEYRGRFQKQFGLPEAAQ